MVVVPVALVALVARVTTVVAAALVTTVVAVALVALTLVSAIAAAVTVPLVAVIAVITVIALVAVAGVALLVVLGSLLVVFMAVGVAVLPLGRGGRYPGGAAGGGGGGGEAGGGGGGGDAGGGGGGRRRRRGRLRDADGPSGLRRAGAATRVLVACALRGAATRGEQHRGSRDTCRRRCEAAGGATCFARGGRGVGRRGRRLPGPPPPARPSGRGVLSEPSVTSVGTRHGGSQRRTGYCGCCTDGQAQPRSSPGSAGALDSWYRRHPRRT